MNVAVADVRPSGQVPLLKHAIMHWLQSHAEPSGRVHGDLYSVAEATKAAPTNVSRALWDLQKMGLVTFRERKHEGANGHGGTTLLTHFLLTEAGKAWSYKSLDTWAEAIMPGTLVPGDLNPALTQEWDNEALAEDMIHEATPPKPPAQALADLLRGQPGLSIRVIDGNLRLGYSRGSTALYALAKAYPTAFVVKEGKIRFIAPEGWTAPNTNMHRPHPGKRGRGTVDTVAQRIVDMTADTPVMREAKASVALDHDPHEGTQSVPPRTFQLPSLGSEITALLAREGRRKKVAEAVAALEAAGLDDDALTVMGRIPDDTSLEREVLVLVNALGYEA